MSGGMDCQATFPPLVNGLAPERNDEFGGGNQEGVEVINLRSQNPSTRTDN